MFKQITHNPEPKIIGVNNGVYQVEFKEKELKKNNNYNEINSTLIATTINDFLEKQDSVSQMKIEHLKGKLLKKAKLTDIMVFTPFFFGYSYLVSQKFVDCLEEEKVSKNEYHLRKVEIINVELNYYLFFVPMIPSTEIDFSNSLMYSEEDFLSDKKNYFKMDNFKDYQEVIKKSLFNRWDKIVLDKRYENNSIINLQASVELFFSDSLIKRMKSEKITSLIVKDRVELLFE